tara:strand:- start:3073 stop:3738 length:666 start_codon:yes stop_codon:yes gene_type:complete
MIEILKYYLLKNDYFQFFFIGIIIYIFFQNTNVINFSNIIPILLTIGILYLLVYSYILKEKNNFNRNKDVLNNFNYKRYKYLDHDSDILLLLFNIKNIFNFNNIEYRKLLNSFNMFFYYYRLSIQSYIKNRNHIYQNCFLEADNILNIINSYGTMSENNSKYVPLLNNIIYNIKMILSRYLTLIEIKNNKEWINNKNTYTNPIYPDEVRPYNHMNDKLEVY